MPERPTDLGAHLAVNYASPSTGRVEDWEWIEDGEVRTMPVGGRVTVNSAEAYIACCLAGLGLIQIPAYDVRRHLDAGELVEVMPGHRAEPMPMALLYPHRQHLSRRLQVFAAWLEELLKQHILQGAGSTFRARPRMPSQAVVPTPRSERPTATVRHGGLIVTIVDSIPASSPCRSFRLAAWMRRISCSSATVTRLHDTGRSSRLPPRRMVRTNAATRATSNGPYSVSTASSASWSAASQHAASPVA